MRPVPSPSSPDSARTSIAVADFSELLPPSEHAIIQAYVNQVIACHGPALLVWGHDALCIAYNRAYRSFAGMRSSALGKPLFKVQPDLERAWRGKLDQALGGQGVSLEAGDSPGDSPQSGWLLPVQDSAGVVRGALAILIDTTPMLEPMRRVLVGLAHDLRDSLVGIRVLSERLARAPKLTTERAAPDVARILEMTRQLEWTTDDMASFTRLQSGNAAQVNRRECDLGALVVAACDEINAPTDRAFHEPVPSPRPVTAPMAPINVAQQAISGPASLAAPISTPSPTSRPNPHVRAGVMTVVGAWDPDAIRRIVINLVQAARVYGGESGEVSVELTVTAREGASISVRSDGRSVREEDAESVFEPWKRGAAIGERRRTAVGLGLFVARELAFAHGGRIVFERPSGGGFMVRAVLPTTAPDKRRA